MSDEKTIILCPYCGNTQYEPKDHCKVCAGHFDPLSLQVTQQHMGPWFIRDEEKPFIPGCSYEILTQQIKKGKVKAGTIIKGPTTRQYWSIARNVPGVSHLVGYCYACGSSIGKASEKCPVCNELFVKPTVRDQLGLAPKQNIDDILRDGRAAQAAQKTQHITDSDQPTDVGDGPIVNVSLSGSAILANLREAKKKD